MAEKNIPRSGIDTVKLRFDRHNFNINTENKLSVHKGTVSDGETRQILLYNDVFGSKAFYNTKQYQVTIRSIMNKVFLYIEFTFTKYFNHKNNEPFLDHESVLKDLELQLDSAGICVSIMEGVVVRLDLFANLKLKHSFETYVRYLSMVNIPRFEKVKYPYSFYIRNKQEVFIIYDKSVEQNKEDKDGHIWRVEYRLNNKKKVEELTPFLTAFKLVELSSYVHGVYTYLINKMISLNSGLEISTNRSIGTKIDESKERSDKRFMNDFLYRQGIIHVVNEHGVEPFLSAVKERVSKTSYQRIKKDVDDLLQEGQIEKVSVSEIKQELFDKLIGDITLLDSSNVNGYQPSDKQGKHKIDERKEEWADLVSMSRGTTPEITFDIIMFEIYWDSTKAINYIFSEYGDSKVVQKKILDSMKEYINRENYSKLPTLQIELEKERLELMEKMADNLISVEDRVKLTEYIAEEITPRINHVKRLQKKLQRYKDKYLALD